MTDDEIRIEHLDGSAGLARDDVLSLYGSVAWAVYTDDLDRLMASIEGSQFVVVARQGDRLIGLARAITDGASIVYLQDILVHPDFQRHGIGRQLAEAVLERYAGVRQKVLLTDDEPGQQAFYESLGYTEARSFGDGSLRTFVRYD